MLPLVEIRVPFTLDRSAIDDVARGSQDSDWQPVKDAATTIAHTEDRAVFDGYAAGLLSPASGRPPATRPSRCRPMPAAIRTRSRRRSPGCGWPASRVPTRWYWTPTPTPRSTETRDHGYPILEQLNRLVPDGIIWAPALRGGDLLTTRGGDYELTIGQDISIGYLQHTAATVDLYLQETFTFAPYTSEASVYLSR